MGKPKPKTSVPDTGGSESALCRLDVKDATEQVLQWMIEGQSGHHIMQAIVSEMPDMKPAKLLSAAAEKLETTAEVNASFVQGWCLEATRDMYRRLIEIGDYPNALRAIKQLREISK